MRGVSREALKRGNCFDICLHGYSTEGLLLAEHLLTLHTSGYCLSHRDAICYSLRCQCALCCAVCCRKRILRDFSDTTHCVVAANQSEVTAAAAAVAAMVQKQRQQCWQQIGTRPCDQRKNGVLTEFESLCSG